MFLRACEDSNFLSTILFMKSIMEFICIIVPIILIVMVSIQLGKIVLGDEKIIPNVTKSIISKMIAAVLVFFVPTLVNLFLSLMGNSNFTATMCWNNANSTTIAKYRAVEEATRLQEKEEKGRAMAEEKAERERLAELREQTRLENEKEASERNKYQKIKGVFSSDVIYYNQCDYKNYSYGSYGSICSHGCGPTSSAVIASTFLGPSGHTPIEATNWICGHQGCTSSGTYAYKNAEYLTSLGLNVSGPHYWTSSDIDMLMDKLSTGNYLALILVVNNSGRAIFTTGGHFFVLTGVKNGEFTIAQVSKPSQNEQTWPLSAFDGDVSNFYLVSK